MDARLYGNDPDDGVGGTGAFFLLLDEPEVYGLPPDPVVTTKDLPRMFNRAGLAATFMLAGAAASFLQEEPMTQVHGGSPSRQRGSRRGGDRIMVPEADFSSYYGRPIVKPAPWENDIAYYLFTGGVAAGSAAARRRRRPHRPARPAAGRAVRLARRTGPEHRLPRARPRQAEPLPQHAARRQADLADVGRHLDPQPARALRRRSRRPPRSSRCSRRTGSAGRSGSSSRWAVPPAWSVR